MPTYDYRCNACEHEFELFQAMSDGLKKKCPQCGKLKLERLIGTGAAVLFKGDGFYETDYRSESYKKAAAADKKPESGNGSESGSKADTKSESKSDSASSSKRESKSDSKPESKPDKAPDTKASKSADSKPPSNSKK